MSKITIEINQSCRGQAIGLLGEVDLHIDIEYSHLLSKEIFEGLPYKAMTVVIARVDKQISFTLERGLVDKGYAIMVDNKLYKDNIKDDYDTMLAEFVNAIISYCICKRLYCIGKMKV